MEAAGATAIVPASQHMRALQAANDVRIARAALKRSIGAGERDVAEVVFTCPWMAETMSLGELLRSQRRWGRARVQKLLRSAELSETKTLNALTERQRTLLAGLIVGGCQAEGTPGQLFLGEPKSPSHAGCPRPADAASLARR
jgi:hypothetical protein